MTNLFRGVFTWQTGRGIMAKRVKQVMRYVKSAWTGPWTYSPGRPLNGCGKEKAPKQSPWPLHIVDKILLTDVLNNYLDLQEGEDEDEDGASGNKKAAKKDNNKKQTPAELKKEAISSPKNATFGFLRGSSERMK